MGCRVFSKHLFSKVHEAQEAGTRIRSYLCFLQCEIRALLLQSVSLLLTDTRKSEIRNNCKFTKDTNICNTSCKNIENRPSEHTPPVQEGAKWLLPCFLLLDRRASKAPNSGWTFLRISGKSLAKSNVGCCSQAQISLCWCPWLTIPALGYRDA